MPFITEELWQNLKQRLPGGTLDAPALIVAPYPSANHKLLDEDAENQIENEIEIIRAIRNTRAEYKVDINKPVKAHAYVATFSTSIGLRSNIIGKLAKATIDIQPMAKRPSSNEKTVVLNLRNADVVIPLEGMVDMDAEKARLSKEMAVLEREISRLTQRLEDGQFTSKAPAAVIEKEKARLTEYTDKLARMKSELKQLG